MLLLSNKLNCYLELSTKLLSTKESLPVYIESSYSLEPLLLEPVIIEPNSIFQDSINSGSIT